MTGTFQVPFDAKGGNAKKKNTKLPHMGSSLRNTLLLKLLSPVQPFAVYSGPHIQITLQFHDHRIYCSASDKGTVRQNEHSRRLWFEPKATRSRGQGSNPPTEVIQLFAVRFVYGEIPFVP